MDTYSVAPPSDGYDYVNTDPSSPYYMWDYKIGSTAHGEVEHVYGDGRTDWVPEGSPKVSAASWTPPAGAVPGTIETGSIPGAPIIHSPAAAPAPSDPAPPVVIGSSPQPITGGSGSSSPPTSGDTGGTPAPSDPSPPTVIGSTPQPITGGSPPTSGDTGGTPAPTDPSAPVVLGSSPQPITGGPGSSSPPTDGSTGGTPAPSDPSAPDPSTPTVVASTEQPTTSSGSSDPTGGTAAPSSDSSAVSGATYTVVHGDTLSGIAESHNISLSQLESLNPQIKDPSLIFPGENVNLGGGGSSTGGTAAPSGATYTVVHGDTLSGIASANGMSTSQIEALNPQIKDPNLIFPGETVNLGGGGTTAPSDSSQSTPAAATPVSSTSPTSSTLPNLSGTGGTSSSDSNDTSAGGGAIGFPEKSSYPFGTIGAEAEKALGETSANSQAAGWVGNAGNESTDIAKQVFEADSHPNTDPLKINDDKNENAGH